MDRPSLAVSLFISMRPKQWIKNFFVLAPIVFSRSFLDLPLLIRALSALALFCLASAAVYMINDLADKEADKRHPIKRLRPIASGRLPASVAVGTSLILVILALCGGYLLNVKFAGILTLYVAINLAYSFSLKHVVLLDVSVIAVGFVLRILGGGVAVDVDVSSWLLLCTLLISLFLALCKRRHEMVLLEDEALSHRKILSAYSPYFLDQLISVVTASTVIAYALYTMSDDVVAQFGNNNLEYTVPFVLYGIFRYLYLVHRKDKGGSPTEIMIKDVPMMVNIGLWILLVGVLLYG